MSSPLVIAGIALLVASVLCWPDPVALWFDIVVMIYGLVHYGILLYRKKRK